MNQEQWTAVEKIIEKGDMFSADSWVQVVDEGDYPALIQRYQQAKNWQQKDVIAILLAPHFNPSLQPIFLDYMQVPITEEMQMFTLAQMLRHFGEEYNQFNRFFSNYELLIKTLGEILAKFGLERPPEPVEETQPDIVRQKQETPLTDIPLAAELEETIAPEIRLLVAIERQDMGLLVQAIAQGADLDARIEQKPLTGCTPLMAALRLQRSAMALRLIESGADVGARRSRKGEINPEIGPTPLSCAAMAQPDMTVVKALIMAGAPVDCPSAKGITPLACAVMDGNITLVQYLLEVGADLQHPTYENASLLSRAVKYDEIEMAQYLLDLGVPIEATTIYGGNALLTAVYEGYIDHVKLLLSNGADPNACYIAVEPERTLSAFVGMTPLALAIKYNRLNMAKVLLKGGADPNQRIEKLDGTQIAPLDFATKRREKFAALLNG